MSQGGGSSGGGGESAEERFLREFGGDDDAESDWTAPEPTFDARTEQNLQTLRPELEALARQHLALLRMAGIDVRVSFGGRSVALQRRLYENRRPGFRVAAPGRSAHNYGAAYDIAIFRDGRYVRNGADRQYAVAGAVGASLGLEWGGDWANRPDYPHYQIPDWNELDNLEAVQGSGGRSGVCSRRLSYPVRPATNQAHQLMSIVRSLLMI